MAKITIEELSDSLKEYLSGLGLTEEQVNSLVQNKLGDLSNLETVNKDNIVNSVNEVKDTVAFVGTAIFGSDMSDDTLMTDSNTVIGAINEVFQRGNDVKQSLVDALIAKDIESSTSESFESLINKISSIEGGSGSIGYATGEGSVTFIITSSASKLRNATLDKPFGFTPTHIILVFDNGAILTNKTTSDSPLELDEENYVYIDSMTSDTLTFNSFSGMRQYSHDFIYYAFDANSSSSESGTGSNILSYETLELSSSDLFIPTNSDSDYYHYSLSDSYNDDDVYLVFADTKAMEDDIGYMQYYSSLYFYPDSSSGFGSILLGHDSGGEVESVTQMSASGRIPIMKTTDRLLENKLVVFYRAGAVSNAFSQSLFNAEPATYQLIEYHTFDLDTLSFNFDYILFSSSAVNNGDGDASSIYSMYDRTSKRCFIMAHGYDNYSYKIDNVPSNAIPIFPTNRYSGLFVSYTGFIANKEAEDEKNESNTIRVLRPGDDVTIYNKTTAVRTYDCSYQDITITGLNGDITAGIRFKANIGTVDSDSNTLVFTRVKLLRNDEVMTSISETLTVPAAGSNYTYDIHYPIQNNDVIKFEFSFNYEDLGSDIANPSIDDPQISINSQIVSYTVKDEEPKDAVLKMIPGDKNLLTSDGGGTWVNNGTPGQVTLTIPTLPTTFKGATLNITTYAGGDTYYVYYTPTVLVNRNGETIDQLFYPDVDEMYLDGDGVRRTISRTLTDLKAGDTIFCQFDITDGEAVTPFPEEYYFVIDNITVTYDTVDLVADSVVL